MPPEARPVWQVARYLRELLEHDSAMADLWIGGEISNLTTSSAGHIYFTLKDQGGALRCAYFRNNNVRIRMKEPMHNGDAVIVHGSIQFYPQGGNLQCIVDFAQPAGVGALQAEFERRRARFEEDGLFDPSRKRLLPQFPRTIGVITSQTGAAYHDITTILDRRWPLATVLFRATPVQGEEAAVEIAKAVRDIGLYRKAEARPDVVIVGRGGGSAEDLWAFNEEPVIRAIHGCPIPVISAVGHETDVTLADLVADVRAPTPSAAAELAAPDRLEVARAVQALQAAMHARSRQRTGIAREATHRLANRMERLLPDTNGWRRRVTAQADGMAHLAYRSAREAREATAGFAARVQALSPQATLARGYALVSTADGALASRAASVAPGDQIEVRWADGARGATVEGTSAGGAVGSDA
ncbi:MAG: exodeoxyribonuclease VII large subunit [Dehalococcoidia bacterium]|nr:exodeoxyribonuclease VII large subunit [Dehalococcoidia bacterium]